jgi:glycerate 2-kinase
VKALKSKDSREPPRAGGAGPLLRDIALEALSGCDPAHAVERAVWAGAGRLVVCDRTVRLAGRGRLLVIGYGKASLAMAEGLARRVRESGGRRTVRGLLIHGPGDAPRAGGRTPLGLPGHAGDHPIPGRASFRAGRRVLALLARVGPEDDLIYLASGGGSALLAAPLRPFMRAEDTTALNRLLVASGAPISAINIVRKHLSAVKGGRLALLARRARSQSTLIVSDVDPERADDVASGPSLPDRSTLEDFVGIIDRHAFAPALPARVLETLHAGRLPETPKPGEKVFRRCRWQPVLSNRDLRSAAVRAGLTRGLPVEAAPAEMTGAIEEATEMLARAVEAAPPGTRLLVLGGEVLTVPGGPGVGGRAQEFALRLALRLQGLGARPWAFLAFGSDGIDGGSPAAGAYADSTTLERARRARLDPLRSLRQADSHSFFRRLRDDVVTGPTGTNVRDLYLLLTGSAAGVEAARRRQSSSPIKL